MPSNGHSLTTAKTSNRSRWVFEDRARNLPCPSVYSVVIKAPPRCQFHHGTHGNARSGGTEAVEEKGLWDPQTTNTPLQTCDRFEQFSPTTFDWPLKAMNSQRRKLQIGRVGYLKIVRGTFRAFPCIPWSKKPRPVVNFTTERTETPVRAALKRLRERDLRDSQTSNIPLINATDLSSFRQRAFQCRQMDTR